MELVNAVAEPDAAGQYMMHGMIFMIIVLFALILFSIIYSMKKTGMLKRRFIQQEIEHLRQDAGRLTRRTKLIMRIWWRRASRRMKTVIALQRKASGTGLK